MKHNLVCIPGGVYKCLQRMTKAEKIPEHWRKEEKDL